MEPSAARVSTCVVWSSTPRAECADEIIQQITTSGHRRRSPIERTRGGTPQLLPRWGEKSGRNHPLNKMSQRCWPSGQRQGTTFVGLTSQLDEPWCGWVGTLKQSIGYWTHRRISANQGTRRSWPRQTIGSMRIFWLLSVPH